MANLTAKFKMIDEMSDRMEAIADSGHSLLDTWEQMGGTANSSFGTAASAAAGITASMDDVSSAATEAASATDHWTSAVGNFDKGALEAIYTTEELVEMGLKSADALSEQDAMFEQCEQAAFSLSNAMETATDIENELSEAQSRAAEMAEALAEADGVSAEAKEALTKAQEEAAEAMGELLRAEENATAAMEHYDDVLISGTTDVEELQAAADAASQAADELAQANERATKATEDLSTASDNAGEELENAGKKGADAMGELESAIAAAGITALLKEMAESAYELADAFSEAEKTVVLATGATGDALESLETSMMNVYARAKSADLSSTSGAIGEINTRLGLTGEKLEVTTELFLDYANVTGQMVVPSIQDVTKLMNQWDVELDRLPGLLDKLTYAGQISGINVSGLSATLVTNKGILQSLGFTLEDSIGLFAQLELQGVSSQAAMTGFRTALNKFSKEGVNADSALQSLIDKIVNAGSESEATAIAVEYFGSRAGAALASSIRNGQLSIDDLSSSLKGAEGALETTAIASQTLSEKWQKANNNMKTAFSNGLQPTLDKASTALAGIMDRTAGFLKDHPKVVKAITAIAVGVGVFVAGIVAYTVATKAAAIAQAALNAVMDANPIYLIATAVAAATVALVGFIAAVASAGEQEEELSYKSQVQKERLEELQAEYDATAEKYGESSYQAQELQWQIEELSEEYNSQKQTLSEWKSKFDEAMSSYQEFAQERQNHIDETELEGEKILNLATRLETLANKTDRSAAEQQEMLVIMEKLNGEIPGLSLHYDELTGSIEGSTDAIIALAEAEVARRKYESYSDELIASIEKRTELQNTLNEETEQYNATLQKQADAQAALDAAVAARQAAEAAYTKPKGGGEAEGRAYASYIMGYANAVTEAQNALDGVNAELEEAQGRVDAATDAVNDNEEAIAGISEEMANLSNQSQNAFETAQTVTEVVDAMAQSVTELAAAYDDAYQAAKTSFDGQFSLFDEAKASMDATVANAQKALDSQLAYWDNYLSNVNVLKETSASDLGITQENYNALMAYVQDGSAEAAGLAQSMVDAINSGNSEAITNLANTVGEVQTKRDEAASAVAEWQIDFNGKMDEIVQKAEQTVSDMNLSDEAATAATATISAYAEAIRSQGAVAIANAKSIAAQVQSALSSANVTVTTGTTGYAEGTDYATPGPHLVGENGPEIVEFRGGEKVYTNEETERIMARSAAVRFFSAPEGAAAIQDEATSKKEESRKVIRLEINGGGAIEVNGAMDEATVLDILQTHLKPVLTSIVKQEIYEEGDLSYDF